MAYTVPHTWVPGDFLRASWLNYTTTDLVDHEARIVTLETAGGGDALTTDGLDQFAATTSAELKTVISDETGSGALVFATSPTLVTPALGTPSAAVLTNATGLPLTTGVTGDLALTNLAPSAAASKLLGRGDSGAGDWEPVTLGTNLAMSGATLNATGGSALSLAQNRLAGRGASSGTGDPEAITLGSGLVLTGTSLAATSGVAGDVTVAKAGSAIGTRARINFIDGTNVTITATDDAGNNEVDVSIASTGGGAAWDYVAPVDGDFAWINQGSASVTATSIHGASALFLSNPADASAVTNLRIRKKAAPSTPYTVTAKFIPNMLMLDFHSAGIGFRQSSDGKCVTFGLDFNSFVSATQSLLTVRKYSAATTSVSPAYVQPPLPTSLAEAGLRIEDDGSNRKCWLIPDGQNAILIHSIGRTDYLTADEVFFYVMSGNTTYGVGMTLLSWDEA